MKKCTIIGGGISGLSLAAFANKDFDVQLLETSDQIGGLIQNSNTAGRVRDHAANGWLSAEPAVQELLDILNINSEIITANNKDKTRFIVKEGKLVSLSPPNLLFGPLLPFFGKFRLLAEPFIAKLDQNTEESLAEFGTRRFGVGVLENLLTPFASGIFACRPEELSVPAAFPKLWQMEQEHGSLIKAGFSAKKTRQVSQLTTLKKGTHQLCAEIANQLGEKIHTNTTALSIKRHKNLWAIQTESHEFLTDYLAVTCPASAQSKLFSQSFPEISQVMSEIQYSSVVVVIAEFENNSFATDPIGFGALMNRQEQQSGILGTLFSSCIFPSHQPEGFFGTRTILGGSIRPDLIEKSEQELQQLVLEHHQRLFGRCKKPPVQLTVIKHHNAIPRYEKGHWKRQQLIREFHDAHPTIRLSGNHIFGVAVKDCIRQSKEHVLDFIHHKEKTHA